jgi:hypothetical protein
MSRYGQRTLVGTNRELGSVGKKPPAGIGVVQGYGVATGGTSSSISVSGQAYTLLHFTSSSSLVVTSSGLFDVLIAGGGGGSGSFNGGAGRYGGSGGAGQLVGMSTVATFFFDAATHTVTIGSAGGSNANGTGSRIGTTISATGGGGGTSGGNGQDGGSGGGGHDAGGTGGVSISGFGGNSGGNTNNPPCSNGGGGAGGAGSGTTGGAGIDILNFTSVSRTIAKGQNGAIAICASAITADTNSGNGGQAGVVFVRFKV